LFGAPEVIQQQMSNGQAPAADSNPPQMETDSQRSLQNGVPESSGAQNLPDFSRPPPMFDPSRPPPQMMVPQPG
jgi:hypothetical protein